MTRPLLALLLVLAAAAPARASLTVDITTPWAVTGHPVPVQIIARSTAPLDLTVDVTCGAVRAHATFAVAAGAPTRRTVLLPPLDPDAYSCAPRVTYRASDGDEGSASGPVGQNDLRFAFVAPRPPLLLANEYLFADVSPEALPDRWQGYPLTSTFIVAPEADDRLTPAQRAALATFSRAGGALVLLGDADRLARWRALGAVPTRVGTDATTLLRPLVDAPAPSYETAWRHRVPGTETVPVGGFVLVALAFAVLVGPLNLWWVIKKRRQRGLFFLTTPLLSLAASGLLIGYNLVSEGLGTKRAAVQLAWLDGERHELVSTTGVTFFAGTAIDALTLDPDALARPVFTDGGPDFDPRGTPVEPGRALGIRWGDAGQTLTGAWIPTRVNTQLIVTIPHADRRRLTLTATDAGGYTLTNGLDVPLTALAWHAPDGTVLGPGAPLAPGASAPLVPVSAAVGHPPFGRLGPAAQNLWARGELPYRFTAALGAPLDPVPGPDASDEAPLEAWLGGTLFPTGGPPPDDPVWRPVPTEDLNLMLEGGKLVPAPDLRVLRTLEEIEEIEEVNP